MQPTDTRPKTRKLRWDGKRIPPEYWGKDHMSTLLYIESRNVDGDGQPIMAQMRTANGRPRRGKGNITPPRGKDCPTILAGGTELHCHDDWDCVDDMVAVNLIDWQGTGTYPILRLTSPGWRLAAAGRQHLAMTAAKGERTWSGFKPIEHLPAQLDAEELAANQATEWSKEELQETVVRMKRLCERFYWMCFHAQTIAWALEAAAKERRCWVVALVGLLSWTQEKH